ncbi:MAG: exodeoxyribonuclease VII large subunit [Phycisphaerales bacterium]|nr:exodeoxyribonuclease VII large subunit [Phycisphaerales bacterium]
MARKPFDPTRAAGGLFGDSAGGRDAGSAPEPEKTTSAEAPGDPAVLNVSALSQLIRSALEGGVGKIRVTGEISNFRAVQGHWYFTLKDSQARIDCMMFRSAADRCTCAPADGMAVVLSGEVTHYPPQGRTQIQCAGMEATGAGDLDARYRQLCAELRTRGYFEAAAKVSIPAMPMCIALLTSAQSAAEADCLDAAQQTFPAARIIAVDIRVQGTQAAAGIAAAIAAVDRSAPVLGIEVILLVRGGGSLEDLWAFNERVVADAIFHCRTPIVTGIGHESDTTIADLVADLRAATPSRAVTEVLPRRAVLVEQLDGLCRRLVRGASTKLQRERGRIELAARSRGMSDPTTSLVIQSARLASRATALAQGIRNRLTRGDRTVGALLAQFVQQHPSNRLRIAEARIAMSASQLFRMGRLLLTASGARLESAQRTLAAIGPQAVLDRGYSITLDARGVPLRSASASGVGERIETIFAEGRVSSVVDEITAPPARGSLDSAP